MADPDAGDPAPPFELPDHEDNLVTLDAFAGQPLVLYFYPGDFTWGCTREACRFRDALHELEDHDANLVGVSRDPPEKHARFRDEHDLPFTLLSDEDGRVAEAYGVDGFLGTRRVTFVIGPEGVIRERIASLLPGSHVDGALEHLDHLEHEPSYA